MIKISNTNFQLIVPVTLIVILFHSVSVAQVTGKQFPQIETSTATGIVVNIPKDTMGKYTLLGMAFSKKSEGDLNTWMEPVFWKFIYKPEGNANQLFAMTTYDVNAYFIPMFTGIKTAATKTAKKKAIKKMDPRLIPNILFYKGKLKPYKEALDFTKKDIPYFFVLDKDGKIIYATSGRYTDEKMTKIEEMISE